MRHWLSILSAAALLSCASAGARAPEHEPAVPRPELLPTIPLTTLQGESTDLVRVTQGHAALVSLWATWCDGCEREMDELKRLDAKAGSGEPIVVGVAVGEEPGKVAEFVRRHGLQYVQLIDRDFAFADAMGERRVPATLVVDRRGRVVFRGGALDARGLAALREATEQQASERSERSK